MAIIDVSLHKESQDRYLTYALSVVSGRALPDVRDGLKPVQRRILYAMAHQLNLKPTGAYRKSAAVVGEVLARFHPHGDSACYEAMVRMAQDFSLRYPLVDGQGNFGSPDGDSAAAYRYTEARLREAALEVVGEIDEETVEFRDNFDGTIKEPVVLPSRLPNLIVNGASGIAVGMATSIPPHNLRETVKALLELSSNPELTVTQILSYLKGPDFPTACQVINTKAELIQMYKTGRGALRMRGVWKLESQSRGREAVIITAIPYGLNKAQLVEKIANLIIEKRVPQLVDVRDESTGDIRVVLELAPEADAEAAMAYLCKHTPLQSNFPVNLTALVPIEAGNCRPELLSIKDLLQRFLTFRYEVVERRLRFELKRLEGRIHILLGLKKVFDNLDAAIKIVRSSEGRADAAKKLRTRFKLTEIQAFAVVDMRIHQLSRTSVDDILAELAAKQQRVAEIASILGDAEKIKELARKDLEEISSRYGDARRSKIVTSNVELEVREEDYVVDEQVFAIVTRDGWLKRVRQTNELGSTRLREGDAIFRAHAVSTLDLIAFCTNQGYLYTLRVADIPSSSGYGSPVQKILKFRDGERIVSSFDVPIEGSGTSIGPESIGDGTELVLVSQQGMGCRFELGDLEGVKRNGRRIMRLRPDDELAGACLVEQQVAIVTAKGFALAVASDEIPERAQAAVGVQLIGVRGDDRVVSALSFSRGVRLVVLSADGKEKEIAANEIIKGRRGLKGRKLPVRGEVEQVRRVEDGDGQIKLL